LSNPLGNQIVRHRSPPAIVATPGPEMYPQV
jgi:hypothetical protein